MITILYVWTNLMTYLVRLIFSIIEMSIENHNKCPQTFINWKKDCQGQMRVQQQYIREKIRSDHRLYTQEDLTEYNRIKNEQNARGSMITTKDTWQERI